MLKLFFFLTRFFMDLKRDESNEFSCEGWIFSRLFTDRVEICALIAPA